MPRDLAEIRLRARQVAGAAPVLQVDVMDGAFVEGVSWPYTPGGAREFESFVREEDGLPSWRELDFEIDLMVREPERVAAKWADAGARRIVVHVESTGRFPDIARDLSSRGSSGGEWGIGKVELGIALSAETPLEEIIPHLPAADFIQCMGIARIGRQGEPFDERVLERLRRLRREFPDAILSVDGGVRRENARELVAAGANRLVAGSAIFGAENPKKAIADLAELANLP